MAERQPGLLPIIPPLPPLEGPSPLIPIIVLVIVGTLRWAVIQALDFWESLEFESEPYDWSELLESVQSHFIVSAILIPICLLLAIQAFGIPQVNPVGNAPPPSPFVKAITQNVWSSILLLVVILGLLLSIPLRSAVQSPWQTQESPAAYPLTPRDRSIVNSGVCHELGILQRRCAKWKGNAGDSVCRELAVLQKRCEKSDF